MQIWPFATVIEKIILQYENNIIFLSSIIYLYHFKHLKSAFLKDRKLEIIGFGFKSTIYFASVLWCDFNECFFFVCICERFCFATPNIACECSTELLLVLSKHRLWVSQSMIWSKMWKIMNALVNPSLFEMVYYRVLSAWAC